MTWPDANMGDGRVQGYDLARGLAVLAMVVLNFSGVLAAGQAHPGWLDLVLDSLDRRAAAALMMISGAGVSLYARSGWGRHRRRDLVRRGAFLVITGSALMVIWSGDILHVYGVLICMGAFLAGCPTRVLAGTALLALAGGAIRWTPLFDYIEEGGYHWMGEVAADLFFTGYFPLFPWAAAFIAGMILGRLDLGRKRVFRGLWGLGMAGLVLTGLLPHLTPADWARMDLSQPTLPAMASGISTGLCLILLALGWSKIAPRRWCRYAVAAGRTSLTFYVLHILMIVALLPVAGREKGPGLAPVCWGAVLCFVVYAAAAGWWLDRFGRGPLEQAMRRFPFIRLSWFRGHPAAAVRP